jgi:large subunit ribosomal protein L22
MAVETPQTEVKAQAKYVRAGPRKAQLVVEQIRGRTVPEARTILAFTTRAAARDVRLVLDSAVANAESNHGLAGDELVVSAAFVGEGPTLKRWRPRARGRASKINKRTCHITIMLAQPGGEALPALRPVPPPAPTTPAPEAETEEAAKPKRAAKPKADEPKEKAPKRAAKPKAEKDKADDKPKSRAAKPKADAPAAEAKPKRAPRRKKPDEGSS